MIRMIACDIDGTLLQNGETALPPEFYGLFEQLEARGIGFCVASGRQFANLQELFGPLAGSIHYICENGALVFKKGHVSEPLLKTLISRERILALSADILARPDCEILLSGLNTSYLLLKDPAVFPLIQHYLGSKVSTVERVEDIEDEIIQVSAYCRPNTKKAYEALSRRWGGEMNVVVAGENWIDFSAASKGGGLEALCAELKMGPDEVMAFGDNFNDISMLDMAGTPVIMRSAPASLRDRYPICCENVVALLRKWLEAGKL